MQIIDVKQGSEAWEAWRNRPTASQFSRIITPARGDYSKSAVDYACEIVAKRLGVWTEPPPSFWMDWGSENEQYARETYERMNGVSVQQVGFVLPDWTDVFGGSPDGLIGDEGVLETKCPKPENLIRLHADGVVPAQYIPQIQGLLLVTGRPWCDFFVWHPELSPFQMRIEADDEYHAKLLVCIQKTLDEITRIEAKVSKVHHPGVPRRAIAERSEL